MQNYSPPLPTLNERIVYVPVYSPNAAPSAYPPPPPPPAPMTYPPQPVQATPSVANKDQSLFERFWVTENGVISISVRNMTIISCLLLTLNLAANLYFYCEISIEEECTLVDFPQISDVIGLPIWDRLFCLTATFFCMGAYQISARCFYKKLYNKVSHGMNDMILTFGIITTLCLPAVAYFDITDH